MKLNIRKKKTNLTLETDLSNLLDRNVIKVISNFQYYPLIFVVYKK